jgi:regulator of PEP synthase PpsR (kinase-PPPase family)
VISDSAGDTALKLAQASMAQYPSIDFLLFRRNFVRELEVLQRILNEAKENDGMIMYTLVNEDLSNFAKNFCEEHDLYSVDVIGPIINEMASRVGYPPTRMLGAQHHLNENYFNRIKAIEFAVQYDDGQDPKGFLSADIVLLGVSRTSKTPLSLYLAQKNLKVANLPLIPQAHIPDELFQVDTKKIVGLTNDPKILNNIRAERMRSYGLDPETAYSNMENIQKELDWANALYEKLDCVVINVAKLSIEETAALILEALHLEDRTYE